MFFKVTDPLHHTVVLNRHTLFGHIYRRHPELRKKAGEIKETIVNPDIITLSKKDSKSLLYFRKLDSIFMLMAVGTPRKDQIIIRTSFFVFNTSKGDPIIWQKNQRKIST